ncbi:Major facilitator superfamily domain, general substrate transporter [Pseudocohnilembus persalinus]|uniref:Lysosomal dipeptide transporter MFSD1 n=1 Tax=Pseudocohnilembus persalinus TaxID=266149 RepID=A0A0V0R897_PSEPJ|nr:Major facilitator superfamily domain, general substrate transporter [Pseudocohnilembus persalinus]|eukprot:KRX10716.1 Major facilitator superfamily domain, general substrate transporter [Pseudocohnilembus persalinus]
MQEQPSNKKSILKQEEEYEKYLKDINKENRAKRWFLLILACLSGVVAQIAFVFPAYFQIYLQKLFDINEIQYNFLFSIQNVPNILFPLIVGIIAQRMGIARSLVMLMSTVLIGHLLQFLAVWLRIYELILFARLFVGIGFANYQIILAILWTEWFVGSSIGLASALQMISGKLAVSFAGLFFSQWQQSDEEKNVKDDGEQYLYQPLLYLLVGGILSFFLCILALKYDYLGELREKRRKIRLSEIKDESHGSIQNYLLIVYQNIKELPLLFYYVIVLGSCVNCLYYGFLNNIQAFLQKAYSIEGKITSLAYVLPMFIAAFVSPLPALICDKTGNYRNIWIFAALIVFCPVIFILSGIQFEYQYMTALFPPVFFGIFYGIVNTMRQPCIRYSVKEEQYALATSISISYINLGAQLGIASSLQMVISKLGISISGLVFGFWKDDMIGDQEKLIKANLILLVGTFIGLSTGKLDYLRFMREQRRQVQNYYSETLDSDSSSKKTYGIQGQISNLSYVSGMIIPSIISPISAFLCDLSGNYRNIWIISSFFGFLPILLIKAQFEFQQQYFTALMGPVLIGIFYGCINIMKSPCIRYTVTEDQFVQAYGIYMSFLQLV